MLKRTIKRTDRLVMRDKTTGEVLAALHFHGRVDVAIDAPPGVKIEHYPAEAVSETGLAMAST